MIIAVVATTASIISAVMVGNSDPPTPALPSGPTAEQMTVSVSSLTPDTPKAVVTPP
jgi:hypothetical protein